MAELAVRRIDVKDDLEETDLQAKKVFRVLRLGSTESRLMGRLRFAIT